MLQWGCDKCTSNIRYSYHQKKLHTWKFIHWSFLSNFWFWSHEINCQTTKTLYECININWYILSCWFGKNCLVKKNEEEPTTPQLLTSCLTENTFLDMNFSFPLNISSLLLKIYNDLNFPNAISCITGVYYIMKLHDL